MSGIIDIEFDFVSSNLSMGKVERNQTVVKTAQIQIKNPANTRITGIETSSPMIKVRLLEDTDISDNKVDVEVTLMPGLPPGRLSETVTVKSNLESKPEAKLRLSGLIIGEFEITPLSIAYFFNDSAGIVTDSSVKVTIVNHNDAVPLELVEISDPDGYLKIEKQTITAGQKYVLVCNLSEEKLPDSNRHNGNILIKTNNPVEKEKEISYRIIKRK